MRMRCQSIVLPACFDAREQTNWIVIILGGRGIAITAFGWLSVDIIGVCFEDVFVVVMACDEDVIPSEDRMASVVDNSDLEEVYNTERYLLYVACTRARDNLLVSAVAPGS